MNHQISIVQNENIVSLMVEMISGANQELLLISPNIELGNPIISAIIGASNRDLGITIYTRFSKGGIQRQTLDLLAEKRIKLVFNTDVNIHALIIDKKCAILPQQNIMREKLSTTEKIAMKVESGEFIEQLLNVISNCPLYIEEENVKENVNKIEKKNTLTKKNRQIQDEIILTPDELVIYGKLSDWRYRQSENEKVPPYIIAHNKHLKLMIKKKCKSIKEISELTGYGQKRAEKYGEHFLKILNSENKHDDENINKSTLHKGQSPEVNDENSKEKLILDRLENWRYAQAHKENLSPTQILSDYSLKKIIKENCQTLDDIAKIAGFGPVKTLKYGEIVLKIMNNSKNATKSAPNLNANKIIKKNFKD